jgi:hypothetical protein
MIEVAMGFGLGFLTACLLTLIIVPFIHERAVRLTTEKLWAVKPSSSLVEMQAEKDLLRAEFAMTVHRLETRLAAMRAKDTALFEEIGKQAAEISHLKIALNEKSASILAYQARVQARRSIVRRVIKLLLWMFDRSYRRRNRLPSTAGLEHVAAPPLQNVSIEPAFQDEPAMSVADRLLAPPQLTLGLRRDTVVPELVLTDLRQISIAPGQRDLPVANTEQIAIAQGRPRDFDGRPI